MPAVGERLMCTSFSATHLIEPEMPLLESSDKEWPEKFPAVQHVRTECMATIKPVQNFVESGNDIYAACILLQASRSSLPSLQKRLADSFLSGYFC